MMKSLFLCFCEFHQYNTLFRYVKYYDKLQLHTIHQDTVEKTKIQWDSTTICDLHKNYSKRDKNIRSIIANRLIKELFMFCSKRKIKVGNNVWNADSSKLVKFKTDSSTKNLLWLGWERFYVFSDMWQNKTKFDV